MATPSPFHAVDGDDNAIQLEAVLPLPEAVPGEVNQLVIRVRYLPGLKDATIHLVHRFGYHDATLSANRIALDDLPLILRDAARVVSVKTLELI